MFVRMGRKLVNLDQVNEIEVTEAGDRTTIDVVFTNGGTARYQVSPHTFEDIALSNCIVPAPKGYASLTHWPAEPGEERGSIFSEPIIAFAVAADELRPITLAGIIQNRNDLTILRPDGKVDLVSDQVFDDEAEFCAYMDKRGKERS